MAAVAVVCRLSVNSIDAIDITTVGRYYTIMYKKVSLPAVDVAAQRCALP